MGLHPGQQVGDCGWTFVSIITLEAMIIMILKNARLNQRSSVLGVWYMSAVIDFSFLLAEN